MGSKRSFENDNVTSNLHSFEVQNNKKMKFDVEHTITFTDIISIISRFQFNVRITNIKEIKKLSFGEMLEFDLIDTSGYIKGMAFNENAHIFKNQIQVNKTYIISNVYISAANTKYKNNPTNVYEIILHKDSIVKETTNDDNIPQYSFKFIELSDIHNSVSENTIDVMGIIKNIGEVCTIEMKSGKSLKKVDVTIYNDKETEANLVFWNDQINSLLSYNVEDIIIVQSARVKEFKNNKTLSIGNYSNHYRNLHIPETERLFKYQNKKQS